MNDSIIIDLIKIFDNLYNKICEDTKTMRFDKNFPPHLASILLHGSIVENAYSCRVLLEKKLFSSIPILSRNMFEAYIDILNIKNNKNYVKNMHLANLIQRKKILLNSKKLDGNNPYLKKVYESEDLDDILLNIENEISDLNKLGIKNLRISEKFQSAHADQIYESFYIILCLHSHNNLHALESRHISKNNNNFSVFFYKEWDKENYIPYVSTFVTTLYGFYQSVYDILKHNNKCQFNNIKTIHNEFNEYISRNK